MNSMVAYDIRAKNIDTVQKLRILLFFHQHPEFKGTGQEIGQQLYLGNDPRVEINITELHQVGLLAYSSNRYGLPGEPDVRSLLQCLADTFKDPLTRQEMLNQINQKTFFGFCQENLEFFHY